MKYAGIGSRETPEDICKLMTRIAEYLYQQGYTLRSGAADGADTAFENGAKEKKEIYLPWRRFNNSDARFVKIPDEAYKIAANFHPVWDRLKDYAKNFHARNVMQILGEDLNTPSDFVVCWTKKGRITGGTGQALRMAIAYEIPIFNLAIEEDKQRILAVIGE